ncbi:MAG: hypothetical protein ACRD1X_01785 [Vicinamibacteria bacterium]
MADLCRWLHLQLERLPAVKYPFELRRLPENGVYFFYEKGEIWGHGGNQSRIVRIGTHREGNFRGRIAEHFLLNEAKMNFDAMKSPPHDRSIFRKNIGRALLNRSESPYLDVWNLDFTKRETLEKYGHLRDVSKERQIEAEVTKILRENFSFRFVVLEGQAERMGSEGLEARLIGTVARCGACRSSPAWLGQYSPVEKIRESGLWLVQHLGAEPLTEPDGARLVAAIAATCDWVDS